MRKYAAATKHLSRDKHLGAFIRGYGPLKFRREYTPDPFRALAETIVYQQLSGRAAATILARVKELWPRKKFPIPDDVLKVSLFKLHSAGVSPQKAAYLKDLAAKFKDGTINPKLFAKMSGRFGGIWILMK